MTILKRKPTKTIIIQAERLNYYLQELSELLNDQINVINLAIPHLDHVIKMIEKNMFRPLPIIQRAGAHDDLGMEEEEVIVNPNWPHLQLIYEFFLRLIVNDATDVKSLKVFFTHTFIQEVLICTLPLFLQQLFFYNYQFLELFDSQEPRVFAEYLCKSKQLYIYMLQELNV